MFLTVIVSNRGDHLLIYGTDIGNVKYNLLKYCTVLYLITVLRCLAFFTFYSTHLFSNLCNYLHCRFRLLI